MTIAEAPRRATPLIISPNAAWPAPGIYRNIPSDQYHALHAVGSTTLKLVDQFTPKRAHYDATHDKQTDAMALGEALHTAILEPVRFSEMYEVATACCAPVKTGSRAGQPCGNASSVKSDGKWYCKTHCKDAPEGQPQSVTAEEHECIIAALESINANSIARDLIYSDAVERELSVVWVEEVGYDDGGKVQVRRMLCKARLDVYNPHTRDIADLKKARAADEIGFEYAISDRRYHIQAEWYRRGISIATGIPHEKFYYVAIEDQMPTDVQVFHITGPLAEEGRRAADNALQTVSWCQAKQCWPGYPVKVCIPGIPATLKSRMKREGVM